MAAEFIKPDEFIIDICGATGSFKRFLPAGCDYFCLDASEGLTRNLSNKGIKYQNCNITNELPFLHKTFDVAVMIISLCHFRGLTLDRLLENLKSTARRIVIVEEILEKKRRPNSIIQKTINFLSETEYYRPIGLFTKLEFSTIMRMHGYQCISRGKRYKIGLFNHENGLHRNKTIKNLKALKV